MRIKYSYMRIKYSLDFLFVLLKLFKKNRVYNSMNRYLVLSQYL